MDFSVLKKDVNTWFLTLIILFDVHRLLKGDHLRRVAMRTFTYILNPVLVYIMYRIDHVFEMMRFYILELRTFYLFSIIETDCFEI